jgi:hypothetical protein
VVADLISKQYKQKYKQKWLELGKKASESVQSKKLTSLFHSVNN